MNDLCDFAKTNDTYIQNSGFHALISPLHQYVSVIIP
jgi:hypothetical protein